MDHLQEIKDLTKSVLEETQELQTLKNDIENYRKAIDSLDAVMQRARKLSVENSGNIEIDQLITVIQDICPALFFCLPALDSLNTAASIAEQKRVEKYNLARSSFVGTQGDKTSAAESGSIGEKVVADLYKGCYKDLDQRIKLGLEIVAAYKKALDVKSKELSTFNTQNRIQSSYGAE